MKRRTKSDRAYWERRALGVPDDAGARIMELIAESEISKPTASEERAAWGIPADAGAQIVAMMADADE